MSRRLLTACRFGLRWKCVSSARTRVRSARSKSCGRNRHGASPVDAAVVLAFDAVYDEAGKRDAVRTHFEVANDYVRDVTRNIGNCSMGVDHPYRRDAVPERLERVGRDGSVLIKWLPIRRTSIVGREVLPFYEALAHRDAAAEPHRLERTAADGEDGVADPALLRGAGAWRHGDQAHCGTRSFSARAVRRLVHADGARVRALLRRHVGVESATRSYGWRVCSRMTSCGRSSCTAARPILRCRPAAHRVARRVDACARRNWMRRDALVKQRSGWKGYWNRAARLLRKKAG